MGGGAATTSNPNVYFGQPGTIAAQQVSTYSMFNAKGTRSAKEIVHQFKNVPNASMRGTTFDARHLDLFIQSGAGFAAGKPQPGPYALKGFGVQQEETRKGNMALSTI